MPLAVFGFIETFLYTIFNCPRLGNYPGDFLAIPETPPLSSRYLLHRLAYRIPLYRSKPRGSHDPRMAPGFFFRIQGDEISWTESLQNEQWRCFGST